MTPYFRHCLLFISFCIASCSNDLKKNEVSVLNGSHPEINNYYNFAIDKTNSLEKRLDNINMALSLANNVGQDSLLIKILNQKTILHSNKKEYDSAKFFTRKFLTLARRDHDSIGIGTAYYKLGLYHDKTYINDSAFFYYNESKKFFELLKDSLSVGKRLRNMAILSSNSSSYNQSDELAIEGVKFLMNTNDQISKASLINCLAINAKKQHDFKESLYWYQQAIEITDDSKHKLIYLSNVANVYRILGEYDKAIDLYQRLLEDPVILNDSRNYPRILDNLTYARWQQSQDFSLHKDFDKALELRENENNIQED